jgi:hypothetical protein
MNKPLSRYNVTVTVGCEGGSRPDPTAFATAAGQAAWSRSASIISAHLADKIISVVTVTAPDRYAAAAVARAVVSDALKRQALSSSRRQTTMPVTVRRLAARRAPELPSPWQALHERDCDSLLRTSGRSGRPGPTRANPPVGIVTVTAVARCGRSRQQSQVGWLRSTQLNVSWSTRRPTPWTIDAHAHAVLGSTRLPRHRRLPFQGWQ